MTENYNLSFERCILSSLIFTPEKIDQYAYELRSSDFYMHTHKNIFEAIMSLEAQKKPVDEEFIKKVMLVSGTFDESAMLEVISTNPINNLKPYVDEIKGFAQKRALVLLGSKLLHGEFELLTDALSYAETELHNIVDMNMGDDDFGIISLMDAPDEKTDFILSDWLPMPRGTISIVAAPGGTGKSWTALQMAYRHARGGHKCAVWLSEDTVSKSKERASAICTDILHTPFAIKNVDVITRVPMQMMINKQFSHANFYKLKKRLSSYDLIVLDPLVAFYGGDENDNSQARSFMQPFMNWASEENKCIVFLHHSKKGAEDNMKSSARGAGAFVDAARTVYEINKIYNNPRSGALDMENAHMREFTLTKDNYGVIEMLNDFKVRREITPRRSARATAVEFQYNRLEMPTL